MSNKFNLNDTPGETSLRQEGFRIPTESDLGVESPISSRNFKDLKEKTIISDLTHEEILKKYYENWELDGKKLDYKNIEDLLVIARKDFSEGKKVDFGTYLYLKSSYNDPYLPDGYDSIYKSTEHELRRWHGNSMDYDYRISLENGKYLTPEDTLIFLNKVEDKLSQKNIPLNFKFYGSNSDALIFYIKKENLQQYLDILEELKTHEDLKNILTKFGEQKPFTGSYENDSYYGFSLGAIRKSNGRLKSTMPSQTMTGYSASLMQNAFDNLLKKYDGNISLINSTEMFSEMQKLHQLKQFGKVSSIDIPFWMNKDMFTEMINK